MNSLFDVFERSLHATHVWINDIADDMDVDAQESYHALKAVLHALRDHLSIDKSAQLAAQLPTHMRGIYYSEWTPTTKDVKSRSKKKFMDSVKKSLEATESLNAEETCRAVFRMLNHHVGSKELNDARTSLAKNVQTLWPEPDGDEEQKNDKKTAKQKKSSTGKQQRADASKDDTVEDDSTLPAGDIDKNRYDGPAYKNREYYARDYDRPHENRGYGIPGGGPQYAPQQQSYSRSGKEDRTPENRYNNGYRGNKH